MPEPATPMSEEAAKEAARLIETAFRDDTPIPAVGPTPPVPQPGRPPMSQKATDASMVMLAAGVASVPIGGSVSLVLYTLGHVDPTALAIGAAAPVALILAIGGLLRRARGVLPEEHHHHYTGPVHQDQRTQTSNTRGLIARTNNQQ